MKRFTLVRHFLSLLKDNDIVIISGSSMGKEAFKYDKDNYFYVIDSDGIMLSLALGVAMSTDKRVFVLCTDGEFLREMNSAVQASVSRCINLFYIIFNEGCYQDEGGAPTIFREMRAIKGFLFNLGFIVNDYTNYFSDKYRIKELQNVIDRNRGPLAAIITVDRGLKKFDKISHTKIKLRNRTNKLIRDKSLGTSLFIP